MRTIVNSPPKYQLVNDERVEVVQRNAHHRAASKVSSWDTQMFELMSQVTREIYGDVPSYYYSDSSFPIHNGRKNFRQDKRYNNIFCDRATRFDLEQDKYLILK